MSFTVFIKEHFWELISPITGAAAAVSIRKYFQKRKDFVDRISSMEKRIDILETVMVNKDYLDDKTDIILNKLQERDKRRDDILSRLEKRIDSLYNHVIANAK